jgi:hypothetical protein
MNYLISNISILEDQMRGLKRLVMLVPCLFIQMLNIRIFLKGLSRSNGDTHLLKDFLAHSF